MTILTIPKKVFEKDIGKLDEKMQEKIAMFSTPIEAITEEDLQLEIFPDRPDLLAYQNFKSSFLSFLGKKTGLREIKFNKPLKDYQVVIDKSVQEIRPYTVCAIVRDLKFNDEKIKEIIDIQEKLHLTLGRKRKKLAIGVYPLEKITLPIRFEARKPEEIKFQPLEFPKEINGRQILSQHPTGREYGYLMEGLNKYSVFVDAKNEILSMPPIINSHKTGKITNETKDIFIECSGFDLGVQKKVLNILCSALDLMGGTIYQMELVYGKEKIITPNFSPDKMNLSIEKANKLLGLNLNEKEIKTLLEKMGYEYGKGIVSVPSFRADVIHEVDIIEDVSIAYGFDKFIPEIPEVATTGEIDKKEKIKSTISSILSGLGMLETISFHLTTKEYQIKKPGLKNRQIIEVIDSKTDYSILRQDLSHYLLRILSENVDVEYPQEIFQIGKVFEGYKESENLSIAISPGNFTRLKQILNYLENMLDIKFEIKESEKLSEYYIDGRVGDIFFNGEKIGCLGEVHPRVLKNFKIKMPVSLLEIKINSILNIMTSK
jgi:phenylalanyl-tRNA synthetase beta chain